MQKEKTKNLIMLLLFFPIYFTPQGIYQVQSTSLVENSSLNIILPFTVLLGMYSILIIGINKINNPLIKFRGKMIPVFLVAIYSIVIHLLLGYLLYPDPTSIILNIQYMSGTLGIFIAIYIFKYRKLDIEDVYFAISIIFLVAIVSNLVISMSKIGVEQTFSRSLYAGTHFGGIHHKLVYYPFIVAIVFLFALPIWESKTKLTLPVYLLITIYILMIQVRGAIISYLLGLILYFFFFSKRNKAMSTTLVLSMGFLIHKLIPIEVLLGRFFHSSSSVLSGRENIWRVYFDNLKQDPFYILRGSYSKATVGYLSKGNPLEFGMHSYHNQYIEILDSYGIIIFAIILIILFYYIYINSFKIKRINNNRILKYWLLLTVIHMAIDLNTNVPIRVTNPAIIYMFYWTSLYLGVQNRFYNLVNSNDIM